MHQPLPEASFQFLPLDGAENGEIYSLGPLSYSNEHMQRDRYLKDVLTFQFFNHTE